ncbi:hypothetical protein DIPPA_06073 [Diplonema papillatum]|nr:hypothetical protein DIPPA_06073 [Diplonema papillatum]
MPPARVALVLALAAAAAAEQFVIFNERELPAGPAGADGFEVVEADRTLYRGAAQVATDRRPRRRGATLFGIRQGKLSRSYKTLSRRLEVYGFSSELAL